MRKYEKRSENIVPKKPRKGLWRWYKKLLVFYHTERNGTLVYVQEQPEGDWIITAPKLPGLNVAAPTLMGAFQKLPEALGALR